MSTKLEETSFRTPSPIDDYRSVVADSTSGTYRQISSDQLVRPTEYMNGGQSISTRQRMPEPLERQQLGVGEVDFDPKFTEAYANLDDVRDRDYQLASASDSPERRPSTMFKGVVNKSKKKKRVKHFLTKCCLVFLVMVWFCNSTLSIFNFFNTYRTGTISYVLVSNTSSPQSSDQLLSSIQQLREELEEIRRNFSLYRDEHILIINDITSQITYLTDSISTSTPSPVMSSNPTNLRVRIDQNCTTTQEGSCVFGDTLFTDSDPPFQSCFTPTYKDDVNDTTTYLVDVFCSLANEMELMPVSSSLIINRNGGYSCFCHGIQIPYVFEDNLMTNTCELHVKRCASLIPVS